MVPELEVYFNDNEPFVVPWLENLWPDAIVDGRSITDVAPALVSKFQRVHLFAGIGGWEYALELAGWPSSVSVWTGSCPCQPFSTAGKRRGVGDDRHLWPEMLRLVEQCRPSIVFGEQVASKDGRGWLSGVRADLEALGYAVGAADLCAAGVGAPHIRQRLYWVAYSQCGVPRRPLGLADEASQTQGATQERERLWVNPRDGGSISRLAYSQRSSSEPGRTTDQPGEGSRAQDAGTSVELGRRSDAGAVGTGNSNSPRPQGRLLRGDGSSERPAGQTGLGSWSEFDIVQCLDGKARRIEPGSFPLANGVPQRVGRIRAYGGAIVPQLAAVFIRSFMEAVGLNEAQ